MPVDDGGVFTDAAGKWAGQHVKKANPAIVEDLRERGINESQAADLRCRLATFAVDWDRPEMNAYDELPPR